MSNPDKTWIQTYTGIRFQLDRPEPDQICLLDIAHSLSQLCRFTGHTREHYSVAQHSILVSEYVHAEAALTALMHDAAEAYIGDLSTPLKTAMPREAKAWLAETESMINWAIREKLKIRPPGLLDCQIKDADMAALLTEVRDLMSPAQAAGYFIDQPCPPPFLTKIVPISAALAEAKFIDRFTELAGHTPP